MTNEEYALDLLHRARAAMSTARDVGKRGTRELSVALTECDTAILWLQHDIAVKQSQAEHDRAVSA